VNGVYKIVNAGVNKGFPDPVNNQAQLVLKKGTKVILFYFNRLKKLIN